MDILCHYLYQATCYLPYMFLMIVVLLYSPALAFFPRLIHSPLTFTAIPIISLVIINTIAFILFHLGFYTHFSVLSISIVFLVTALFRFHRFSNWQNIEKLLLSINFSIILPLVAICGLSAFMYDDALVSWNFWAHQYYLGNSPADMSNGYPQFFPLFLSYCYKFLGTFEYQGAVKALLVVFPFTLLNCIAFSISKINHIKNSSILYLYFLVAFISIFPGFLSLDFYRFYSMGYADPLLAAAITLSALLLLRYCEEKNNLYLILAVISGIAASLTKQPGFLWVLLGFPAILIGRMIQQRQFKPSEILAILVIIIPVLFWLTGSGEHFAHNTGVINRSLNTHTVDIQTLLKALWESVLKYWIFQPTLLLLYIWAFFSLKNLEQKILFWSFIIPGTVLWFIFGNYNIRLGLHLLVLCAILIASGNFKLLRLRHNDEINNNKFDICFNKNMKKINYLFLFLGIILFIFFSIREQNVEHNGVENHRYPLNASKTIIYQYFSLGAEKVYADIFKQPDKKIWISGIYTTPIFYGNNFIIHPPQTEDIKSIYQNIITTKPDYLFTSGKFYLPASSALLIIASQCPDLFQEIPLGRPVYRQKLFKLVYNSSSKIQCDTKF